MSDAWAAALSWCLLCPICLFLLRLVVHSRRSGLLSTQSKAGTVSLPNVVNRCGLTKKCNIWILTLLLSFYDTLGKALSSLSLSYLSHPWETKKNVYMAFRANSSKKDRKTEQHKTIRRERATRGSWETQSLSPLSWTPRLTIDPHEMYGGLTQM